MALFRIAVPLALCMTFACGPLSEDFLGSGTAGTSVGTNCPPGEYVSCECPGGASGVLRCREGAIQDPCTCADSVTGGGIATSSTGLATSSSDFGTSSGGQSSQSSSHSTSLSTSHSTGATGSSADASTGLDTDSGNATAGTESSSSTANASSTTSSSSGDSDTESTQGDPTTSTDDATTTGSDASGTTTTSSDTHDTASDTTTGGSDTSGGDDTGTGDEDQGTFARGIHIHQIEANQAVATPIWQQGAAIPVDQRNAPLVRDRPLLVRAFWRLDAGWQARVIEARLTTVDGVGTKRIYIDRKMVVGPSSNESPDENFGWIVPAETLSSDTSYSIGLFEVAAGIDPPVRPRVPEVGRLPLGVSFDRMRLEVVVVPLRFEGRAPTISQDELHTLERELLRKNPLQMEGVNISVHDVLDVPDDSSLEMLSAVTELRAADLVPDHVYYLGISDTGVGTTPVTGWVAQIDEPHRRVSLVRGHSGWELLAVHGLGHGQGLQHNPGCGAADAAEDWPYDDESHITTQGWDVFVPTFFYDGREHHDYMSYCHPQFVSDFTYRRTGATIAYLSNHFSEPSLPEGWMLHGVVNGDAARWFLLPRYDEDTVESSGVVARLRSEGSTWDVQGRRVAVYGEATRAVEVPWTFRVDAPIAATVWVDDQRHDIDVSALLERWRSRDFPHP